MLLYGKELGDGVEWEFGPPPIHMQAYGLSWAGRVSAITYLGTYILAWLCRAWSSPRYWLCYICICSGTRYVPASPPRQAINAFPKSHHFHSLYLLSVLSLPLNPSSPSQSLAGWSICRT